MQHGTVFGLLVATGLLASAAGEASAANDIEEILSCPPFLERSVPGDELATFHNQVLWKFSSVTTRDPDWSNASVTRAPTGGLFLTCAAGDEAAPVYASHAFDLYRASCEADPDELRFHCVAPSGGEVDRSRWVAVVSQIADDQVAALREAEESLGALTDANAAPVADWAPIAVSVVVEMENTGIACVTAPCVPRTAYVAILDDMTEPEAVQTCGTLKSVGRSCLAMPAAWVAGKPYLGYGGLDGWRHKLGLRE